MDEFIVISDLVRDLGGPTKAAVVLGVKQPTVSGWLARKHGMSPISAMRAEFQTGGKYIAADLCPKLKTVS